MKILLQEIVQLEPKLDLSLKPSIDALTTEMARTDLDLAEKLPRQQAGAQYWAEKYSLDSKPILAASFQQPSKLQNFDELSHRICWLKAMKSGAEFHLYLLNNLPNLVPKEKESILSIKHQLEDLIGKVNLQLSATKDAQERMKFTTFSLESVEKWANAIDFYLKSPLEEGNKKALQRQFKACEVNFFFLICLVLDEIILRKFSFLNA